MNAVFLQQQWLLMNHLISLCPVCNSSKERSQVCERNGLSKGRGRNSQAKASHVTLLCFVTSGWQNLRLCDDGSDHSIPRLGLERIIIQQVDCGSI